MPNGKIHNNSGVVLGISAYLIIQNNSQDYVDLGELILSLFAGISTARLPDILEPATSPNHRAFFHSYVFGLLIGFAVFQIWRDLQTIRTERKLLGIKQMSLKEILDILLIIIICSVLLHLIMDGFTPKGLPII